MKLDLKIQFYDYLPGVNTPKSSFHARKRKYIYVCMISTKKNMKQLQKIISTRPLLYSVRSFMDLNKQYAVDNSNKENNERKIVSTDFMLLKMQACYSY